MAVRRIVRGRSERAFKTTPHPCLYQGVKEDILNNLVNYRLHHTQKL